MNRLILLLLFMASAKVVFSQGPPITVETPVMLGLGGNGIRTFGKFISKENAKIYVQPIGVPYNVTSKFQIGGILPFKLIKPNEGETTTGLSDVAIFAKYQLYKKDGTAKTFRILAKIKQTFPTGKTRPEPAIGSDLYQTYVGLIIGRITSTIGIYADFGYNLTGQEASDNFLYNFSIGLPMLPQQYPQKQVNAFLEFNGNYLFDNKVHTLFISPGLQFIPGRRILFEASFQIPLLQQNSIENKTNYTILFGTRFLIN